MKKSFIFYGSWGAMIAKLPDVTAGQLIKMICQYELYDEINESDPTVSAIFESIRPILDQDNEKYQKKVERMNELNAKRSRDKVATKSSRNRNEIVGDNDNVNDNDNVLSKDNINIVRKPDYNSEINLIVDYLNDQTQSNFKPKTDTTRKSIIARLKEGYTVDDFKRVIDAKVKDWSDSSMREYLRPQTLFRPSNFEAYLNEANRPEVKNKSFNNSGVQKNNIFNQYEQRNDYDFDALERALTVN
ncbi:MAG: conserved phage C-terminal domain-containing protein [Bacteroidaceae bacterium]|nr:conserved phage C-terminal domain-containing protein [Bacteroidaceae bacterium]